LILAPRSAVINHQLSRYQTGCTDTVIGLDERKCKSPRRNSPSGGEINPFTEALIEDFPLSHEGPVVDIKAAGAVPGIQLVHAGRKASANRPWEGDDHIAADDARGWPTIAPSAITFGGGLSKVSKSVTLDDIARVQADFIAAAIRAREAGFEWLELHFAHGHLGQSFFSLHSNQRTDAYGGDAVKRGRFMLKTLTAVRKVWPDRLPLTARFGVIEYDGRDEQTLLEAIEQIKRMEQEGLDMMSVSIGISTPAARIPWRPSWLVPVAGRVRREAGLPFSSAWGIGTPELASTAVQKGDLDLVMVGRGHLADLHWPYAAAEALGVNKPSWTLPAPYAHWLESYTM
jgi:2,4-dienoyl-CoA reductase-like NADH-dependent reductase (Old Yellow Enzyme family)